MQIDNIKPNIIEYYVYKIVFLSEIIVVCTLVVECMYYIGVPKLSAN